MSEVKISTSVVTLVLIRLGAAPNLADIKKTWFLDQNIFCVVTNITLALWTREQKNSLYKSEEQWSSIS